jgi:UDP-N-acetylglucosamine--N-acetylmuramyl-(pentapeptide) pyrophosphoryl-undecaprenol N-acetylglucosamine transferase
MSSQKSKILFAAGGTGGHLFPAQTLAEQLMAEKKDVELHFAGAKLSQTSYFDKEKFAFSDIDSTTPFRGNIFQAIKSIGVLFKGIRQSLKLLSEQKPDLVVGFGSFHSFPILCAAALKNIPLILFESNAIPGKVVRLFSKKALLTAFCFPDAKSYLKGKTVEVEIPRNESRFITKQVARRILQLDLNLPTLLVFGGSQGAKAINQQVLQLLPLLNVPIQLIHFTGNEEMAEEVMRVCKERKVRCYVRKFEPQIDIAWRAADIVICRAGAMTLSELLYYEVPGILIPYPYASDQHQLKNAEFLEKTVRGAIPINESALTPQLLASTIEAMPIQRMKKAIQAFKTQQKKANLGSLIIDFLESRK